ncbi:Hypothetical Protein NTJ_00159 [Nesidiocoris tenuis]|uniref:Reverse transcriptase domain-containing protein n=1 Tax=Nesidiocoris tenuis TaxID=355587 RepID=A0ABN7A5H7_9HEMI|nr:Hypothetical Protein NTJ_00159 [Nesidiocoris tenuis]
MCKLKNVHLVKEEYDTPSQSDNEAFIGFTQVATPKKKCNKWHVNIKINGINDEGNIDTGAEVNVVPHKIYKKRYSHIKLSASDRILTGADATKRLRVVGQFRGTIQNKKVLISETFYVVIGVPHIPLSFDTCERLKLIKRIESVSTVPNASPDPIAKYPSLFNGLGKTKEPYRIKLVKDAIPYSLNVPRRVPLPLKPALRMELDKMVKSGVIREVNSPTPWCAPIVIASKPNNKIRVCVDLTKLNQFVEREKYPMPAIDYTLGLLEGAKVFTQLDANSGFWQIPLTPDCQLLTTFITPFGRFCFQRLPFGISSAPEVFQRTKLSF